MAQLWHGIDSPAFPAQNPAQGCKNCGKKATGWVSQRGTSPEKLELWQISTIIEAKESWN
jgi:hypothetical protein